MHQAFVDHIQKQIADVKQQGLYKPERVITSPQSGQVHVNTGRDVINMCANNYLGLANHPDVVKSAQQAIEKLGYGMASVRFICGTHEIHKTLEARLSRFLGLDDTILYSSCFDANGGVFETLLGEEDAVISDALNHASIIDGIRLCKAQRYRYSNSNMEELEKHLQDAQKQRFRLVVTDGVFSMDGYIANLKTVCDLAEKYNAMVMVDDSHAVGFVGKSGRGTPEHCGVMGRVDLISGTLGKALGGASGGYIAGRGPLIEWLRQRSRPYLFSNTLMPAIAAASLTALDLVEKDDSLRIRLRENATHFRAGMEKLGFKLLQGEHPIIPVMLGDAALAGNMAAALLEEGVYVIGFSFPVVPMGQARIRTQMSAALTREQLDRALAAFGKVGRQLGVI